MAKYDSVKEQVAAIYRSHLEKKFGDRLVFDEIHVTPGWMSGMRSTLKLGSCTTVTATCSNRTGSTASTGRCSPSYSIWE